MLTPSQVAWAKGHDWFLHDRGDGSILVVDRYSQKHEDGRITHHEDFVHFREGFRALRDWAGY